MSRSATGFFRAVLALTLIAAAAQAQETVDVTLPISVTFNVSDVSQSTEGSPSPSTVSFDNASLSASRALRISVQADTAGFTPPSGSAIPASKVSWAASGASGGVGSGGTLSSSAYTQVYQSDADPSSGGVDVTWTLAAPGSGIRAGNHTLTVRWKLESVSP